MTNREWLETLTDEEFADWATEEDYFGANNNPHLKEIKMEWTCSHYGVLQWLKQNREIKDSK